MKFGRVLLGVVALQAFLVVLLGSGLFDVAETPSTFGKGRLMNLQWSWRPSNIRFQNSPRLVLVLTKTECNIFHQLWLWTHAFREIMEDHVVVKRDCYSWPLMSAWRGWHLFFEHFPSKIFGLLSNCLMKNLQRRSWWLTVKKRIVQTAR